MSAVHKDGKAVTSEKEDSEFATFSMRISKKLADQIDARRKISKRSRNKECELLLERQIEAEVDRDRLLVEKMAAMNLNP